MTVRPPRPDAVFDVRVEPLSPDDYRVTITRSSGAVTSTCGRELDDIGDPFDVDHAEELLEYLLGQRVPADLIYRELDRFAPGWDARAELSRRSNTRMAEQRTEDRRRRTMIKDRFRRGRTSGR